MKIAFSKPSQCLSLLAWLCCEWDIRKRWEGPSRLIREVGVRIFGVEITWERVHRG